MRLALVLVVLLPSPAQAQRQARFARASRPPSSPVSIGEQVVTRYAKPLKVGNQVVADGTAFRVYHVAQIKDKWLWLESDSVSGWVDKNDVLPYTDAIDHFTRDIAAHPKVASAYTCRGIVRHAGGEFDAAIADYNAALRLDPGDALTYHNRGLAWHEKREYDQAMADYDEALRLDPKFAAAYRARGLAWHKKNNYDKAISDYDAAIRLDPSSALAYHNRGLARHEQQHHDQAIADCNEAIRLDAKCAAAYHTRGLARQARQHYPQAIADYHEAMRLDPQHPLAYGNCAWLWATCPDKQHRDGRRAMALASKACELTNWNDWRFVHTLAAACAEAGDFDNAVKHGAAALSLAPAEQKQLAEQRLEGYKGGQPYREDAVN